MSQILLSGVTPYSCVKLENIYFKLQQHLLYLLWLFIKISGLGYPSAQNQFPTFESPLILLKISINYKMMNNLVLFTYVRILVLVIIFKLEVKK